MGMADDRIKAIKWASPERIPVSAGALPSAWMKHREAMECGVSVVNPQVGANGLANLAATCKCKVCVDLDLNRQMFPFWKPADIDAHVRESVETLGLPEGGLWLKAEIADDVPLANVEAICAALEKYCLYFSAKTKAL